MNKKFDGVLVINWKTKGMRVVRRKPYKMQPYEIPIKLDITVEIPETKETILKGNITVPEYKVNEMILDAI